MTSVLDNIFWHTLTGPQAHFAAGAGDARRYAPGFSPILGFRDPANPAFDALLPYCNPGEQFYVGSWSGPPPPDWEVLSETRMVLMVRESTARTGATQDAAIRLGAADVARAVELATLTRPGPFGPRTIELGEYYGYFEGERLIAMAGERMHAGNFREISGVCTHPDFQGRGSARTLMMLLIDLQLARGQTPFLHVMSGNTGARRLYAQLGFRDYHETPVRIISRA